MDNVYFKFPQRLQFMAKQHVGAYLLHNSLDFTTNL